MKHFLDTMRSPSVGLKNKLPRPIPNVYNVKGPNKKKKKLREQYIYIYIYIYIVDLQNGSFFL